MTLQEAIRSGKKFRRGNTGVYVTFEDYSENFGLEREDVLATDYEVEPEVSLSFTEAEFAEAWNRARVGTLGVKPAGQSDFYRKLVAELKNI